MGVGIVLFFFLGGVWLLFEMIFGLLPKARTKRFRIALVIGAFPASFLVIGYSSLMTLGILRSEMVPPEHAKLIAWTAVALVFTFPIIVTYIAFRKYHETQSIQSNSSETGNAST